MNLSNFGSRVRQTATSMRGVVANGRGHLLGATLVQSVGQGTSMACSAVYFVTIVGLAPAYVGMTHSVSTLAAMTFAVLISQVADRWGSRNLAFWLSLGAACAVASYALVVDLISFVLVQLLVSSLRMGKQIGESALVGQLVSSKGQFRAYQRSVSNIGVSLGTLTAALPLYLNTREAYLSVMFFNAATLIVGAALIRALPASASRAPERTKTRRWEALRDKRYVAVGLLTGVMEIRDSLLTIALPLWLAHSMYTPRTMVSVLLFANTTIVILLQVWASRHAGTVRGAVRTFRRGGFALAFSCAVIGSTMYLPLLWSALILLAGIACFTFGEMWTSAGGWTLSYELANPHAHGQYQSVFEMTSSVGLLLGPTVATTVALPFGVWGWLAIGVSFAVAGLVATLLVRTTSISPPDRSPEPQVF